MFQLNLGVSKTIVWRLFVFLEYDEKMVNVIPEDTTGIKRGICRHPLLIAALSFEIRFTIFSFA
jgi:hypothetical protein